MDTARLLKRVKNIQIASSRLIETILAGNYRSVFRGQGMEFDEVREYVQGDDARLIDWNVSSRMGSPFTKVFREERELSLFLVGDVSSSLSSGVGEESRRETAALVFAVLAFAAVQNNDRVGGIFFSDRIEGWFPPMKGKRHVLSLIRDMLSWESAGKGSDLTGALRTVNESLERRGIVIIISDFKCDGYWKELSHLSKKHDVIAVRITDNLDVSFPATGYCELQDPETGDVLSASGISKSFSRQYNDFWKLDRANWLRECRKRRVDTLSIAPGDPVELVLTNFFKSRRRGR